MYKLLSSSVRNSRHPPTISYSPKLETGTDFILQITVPSKTPFISINKNAAALYYAIKCLTKLQGLHAAVQLKLPTLITTDNGKVGDRGQCNQLYNFFVT
jgi:hypothetical protein